MKRKFLYLTTVALIFSVLFSNCATIVSRSSYPILVKSDPAGATVSITDKKGKEVFKGISPSTVILKSGAGYFSRAEYQVKISISGYTDQTIPVLYKLNGWYFGNLLFGGIIGMLIIDPASGAMWKLETPPINVTLAKSATIGEVPTLKIMDINSLPLNMRDKLVRVK